MIFPKYKMLQLPNDKYLVAERYELFSWKYPRIWEYPPGYEDDAMMCFLSNLTRKEIDEIGKKTMKDAIVRFCKVKNILQDKKDGKLKPRDSKVLFKWANEADMLADMDDLDS